MQTTWIKAGSLSALKPNDHRGVKIGGRSIAIYNVDGTIYATDDVCTHAYALLSTGFLEGDVVECPLHAGRFNVKTGEALCAPVEQPVEVFRTRIVGDDIEVEVRTD